MKIVNVFFALLIAGFLMPFIWQAVKRFVLRWTGKLAAFASLVLDLVLAAIVLAIYGDFSFFNLIAAAIIVFVVSRTTYDHIVLRYFPNRGSV